MIKFLLILWQFPQILVGKLMSYLWTKYGNPMMLTKEIIELCKKHGVKLFLITESSRKKSKLLKILSGFSLGPYICLSSDRNIYTIKHEIGHSYQSKIFGLLYLIIVGIPSAVGNNVYDRIFHKKWSSINRVIWYYNRFPEKQANDRMGIGIDNVTGQWIDKVVE